MLPRYQVGSLSIKDQVGSSSVFRFHFELILSLLSTLMGHDCTMFRVFIEAMREASLVFVLGKFDGILRLDFDEIVVGNATPVWYVSLKFCSRHVISIVLVFFFF